MNMPAALRNSLLLAAWCAVAGPVVGCDEVWEQTSSSSECATGVHWAAGDMGHPEMHPGGDCVGCHVEHGAPPLALGGTVYHVAEYQEEDCYGVEGVTVQITDAKQQVFTLESNRAGNFYLEGDPSIVSKPFSVVIHGWAFDGTPTTLPMVTKPETGDCGQCHGQRPGTEAVHPTRKFPITNININHRLADYGIPAAQP
jgi:hypothetical protein